MSEKRMEAKLAQLLDRVLAQRSGGWAETFKEAGVSADNRGVVLYIGSGQEFQITIVESTQGLAETLAAGRWTPCRNPSIHPPVT